MLRRVDGYSDVYCIKDDDSLFGLVLKNYERCLKMALFMGATLCFRGRSILRDGNVSFSEILYVLRQNTTKEVFYYVSFIDVISYRFILIRGNYVTLHSRRL